MFQIKRQHWCRQRCRCNDHGLVRVRQRRHSSWCGAAWRLCHRVRLRHRGWPHGAGVCAVYALPSRLRLPVGRQRCRARGADASDKRAFRGRLRRCRPLCTGARRPCRTCLQSPTSYITQKQRKRWSVRSAFVSKTKSFVPGVLQSNKYVFLVQVQYVLLGVN